MSTIMFTLLDEQKANSSGKKTSGRKAVRKAGRKAVQKAGRKDRRGIINI